MSEFGNILIKERIEDTYKDIGINLGSADENIVLDKNDKVTGFIECKVEFENYSKNSLDISELKLDLISIKEKIIDNIKDGFEFIAGEKFNLKDEFVLSESILFFNSLEIEADCIKFKLVFRKIDINFIKILLWLITLNKKKNSYFKLNKKILYRIYVRNIFFRFLNKEYETIYYSLRDVKLVLKKTLNDLELNEDNARKYLEDAFYKNITGN